MDRTKKEQVVAELHERLKGVKLAVLAGYTGMNVSKIESLRNDLRKSGTEFRIIKNTLLRIASQETSVAAFEDHLKGPLAIILNSGDVVEPTKVLVDFARKNSELDIKAGLLDGRLISREQLQQLAELPSREVLLGKLLSVLVGAQTNLVNVLSAVPRSFVQVLEAYRSQKEKLA